MYEMSLQRGRVSILCYIRDYLHHGFKISMLLKYNILLKITLLTWLLNIFVCFLNLMILFYAFMQKHVFIIIEIYDVVAIFKCL